MKLSVIIPCLNETGYLTVLLSNLESSSHSIHEIIVVDASLTNGTIEIAKRSSAMVLKSSTARRSIQMDIGAKSATGDVLLFIHADSIPPANFCQQIESSVSRGCSFGCFRLKFTPSNNFLRFFEVFVGLPWLLCRGGDQGLFISSKFYNEMGGFDTSLWIMEDIDIIRRGTKKSKFAILQSRMKTSSRAYLKYGNLRLQFAFAMVHLVYWLGMDSKKIKLKLNNYLKNERV